MRRDPRATLHVQGESVLSYAVAEGHAEVSAPSTAPGDATGRELLAMAGGFDDAADEAAFLARIGEGPPRGDQACGVPPVRGRPGRARAGLNPP